MAPIEWRYGENEYQKYYDAKIGDDYLCVFSNNWNPETWLGMINDRVIYDRTRNNRQRRKQGLPLSAPIHELTSIWLLRGSPAYMMKKTAYCYRNRKNEISE